MKTSFYLLLFFVALPTFAQTMISGKIVGAKNKAVAKANVYIDGTYDGAFTNDLGEFSFTTTAIGNQILVVSALTYEPKKMDIAIERYFYQTIAIKSNTTELDEVVITAGTLEAGGRSKVSVLKPLDILTTAGNPGDIISALQTLPGTQIVGESGRLFVRGGEANETQTFIDGIRVAQPYLQTTNNVPTRSTFSPLLFKGTSFSTGGYSAEYGEALSSVLIMSTIDEPEIEKTDIGVMSVGTSVGSTKKWEKNSLSVNASYINLKPYQMVLPDNIAWVKPYESIGGESVFRQHFERGLLKFYASYTASDLDVKQHNINYPDQLHLANSNSNLYSNLSYKGRFGSNWNLFAGVSYANSFNKGLFDVYNFTNTENASNMKLKLSKPISDKVRTHFGVDYLYTNFSETLNNFDNGYHSNILAAFSETDFLFSKKLVAKAGFRFSKNYLLGENNFAPRLALAYKVSKTQQFSMAYGTFEQAPKPDYLKYASYLNSEKAQHYILSYEYSKEKQLFKAEAYYKNYDNLVKYDTQAPMYNSYYTNNGKGYAKGIELFWRDNKNIRNLEYWVSYSFIDSQRDYANFAKEATPSFVANHTLSVVSKYWIPKWRSQIGGTYTFASGRPFNNPNEVAFMNGRTKSYNNLSFNWAYLISQQKILFFSVTNIAGIKNVYGYDYANTKDANGVYQSQAIVPTADRFFFVGFFWTLSKDKKTNQLENM